MSSYKWQWLVKICVGVRRPLFLGLVDGYFFTAVPFLRFIFVGYYIS